MCKFNFGEDSIYQSKVSKADLFTIKLVDYHLITEKPKSDFQETVPSIHETELYDSVMEWFGKIGIKKASLDDFRKGVEISNRRCFSLGKIKSQESQIQKRRMKSGLVISV